MAKDQHNSVGAGDTPKLSMAGFDDAARPGGGRNSVPSPAGGMPRVLGDSSQGGAQRTPASPGPEVELGEVKPGGTQHVFEGRTVKTATFD